jgi:capsule polysaccharide modification protein KpsS
MESLKQIANKYRHVIWMDDVSIHQLIPTARAVVVVNSGTGLESLLHQRPVVTFGRADYDAVTNRVEGDNLEKLLADPKFDQVAVKNFVDNWYAACYNTIDETSFSKLP